MPAPSKTWVTIADSQVDADSPLDSVLMTGMRDNEVHLKEWIGKDYTAAQNHNHDGVNSAPVVVPDQSISPAKLALYGLNRLINSYAFYLPTERVSDDTNCRLVWRTTKAERIFTPGLYTVSFDAYRNSDDTCYAQLFIDDVAVGTQRTLNGVYTNYTEDIYIPSGSTAAPVLQLKVKLATGSGVDYIYVKEFFAKYHFITAITVTDA